MLRVWSDDVTLLPDGPAELDAEDIERLRAAEVTVDKRRVAELRGLDSALMAVAFADGGERPCGGLLVPVTLHQRSARAELLGELADDLIDAKAREEARGYQEGAKHYETKSITDVLGDLFAESNSSRQNLLKRNRSGATDFHDRTADGIKKLRDRA